MRFTPVSLALCGLVLVSGSAGMGQAPAVLAPQAAALAAAGNAALASGAVDTATDDFEAALAISPGNDVLLMDLAAAARAQGMQGKALHYYRVVLTSEPQNLDAISGEGQALAEKGALAKAQRNLAQLHGLCGDTCAPSRALAAVIARGPQPQVLTAEAVKPKSEVSAN